MKKAAVLLAGCGVYDGSEIHESVLTLLYLNEAGIEPVCIAPDRPQYHVINHITGEEMKESRNILVESARIARGSIVSVRDFDPDSADALVIPGGFGAAKNLNQWALKGPAGDIFPEIKELIVKFVNSGKPVAGLCMGPTVIAKALEGTGKNPRLTVGTTNEKSPYDIKGISEGISSLGSTPEMKSIREISVDTEYRVITAPCYMMEADISQVAKNIKMAMDALAAMLKS